MHRKTRPRKQMIKIDSEKSQHIIKHRHFITVINTFRKIYDKVENFAREESLFKNSNGKT